MTSQGTHRARWIALLLSGGLVLGLVVWASVVTGSSQHTETQPAPHTSSGDIVSVPRAATTAVTTQPARPAGPPVRVTIPRLGITLPVVPGVYDRDRDTWNVSMATAQFATVSVPPNGERGMTLVYAHNSRRLFGSLSRMEPGDLVHIETETGTIFVYRYTGEDIVRPTDTAVFAAVAEGPPRLVLLTCSGSWNEKRRLLRFALLRPRP